MVYTLSLYSSIVWLKSLSRNQTDEILFAHLFVMLFDVIVCCVCVYDFIYNTGVLKKNDLTIYR